VYRVLRPVHHKQVPVPKLVSVKFPPSSHHYTYLTRRVDFRSVPFWFVLEVDFVPFVWKFGFFECKLSLRMTRKEV
jgi:hypothetical protein